MGGALTLITRRRTTRNWLESARELIAERENLKTKGVELEDSLQDMQTQWKKHLVGNADILGEGLRTMSPPKSAHKTAAVEKAVVESDSEEQQPEAPRELAP